MRRDESGVALVLALMLIAMVSTLAVAVLLATASETLVTASYGRGAVAVAAADGAAQRVVNDLLSLADWNSLLDGSVQSGWTDGPSGGTRALDDGRVIDLTQVRNMANCAKATTCSAADLVAVTPARPWGANNPVWQFYGYGRARDFGTPASAGSPCYVVVFVGDDGAENDGDPRHDGVDSANPGAGIVAIRAEAFGPGGVHRVVEIAVARADPSPHERGYVAQSGPRTGGRSDRSAPVGAPGGALTVEFAPVDQ